MARTKLKSNDCMIDLETLGTRAGCQIVSIGACFFSRELDPKSCILNEYYSIVHLPSQEELGLFTEDSTLNWWNTLGSEAGKVMKQAMRKDAPKLHVILDAFGEWLKFNAQGGVAELKPWSNGADYDQPILIAAFAVCDIDVPWRFRNARCFRTLKSEFASQEPKRQGTYHNALDDAKHQARWAATIFKRLAEGTPKRRGV